MAAEALAELLLALSLRHGHPGRSPYSLELMPECGRDPRAPTCAIAPLCRENAPMCRAPRYSAARGGWVRLERRPAAINRFAKIAKALAATTERLAACRDESSAYCRGVTWASSERSLALAGLTVVLHESGLREDVMFGHPPLGRGPRGEACLMQVAPEQAARIAPWLGSEARDHAEASPTAREALARSLLGDDQKSLERCFEVGLRLLMSARRSCERAGLPWDSAMFALYGTGASCRAPGMADKRTKTFRMLSADRTELPAELGPLLRD